MTDKESLRAEVTTVGVIVNTILLLAIGLSIAPDTTAAATGLALIVSIVVILWG